MSVSREAIAEWFVDFKLAYPERAGDYNWSGAQRAASARLREGHTPLEFIEGAKRYCAYCKATGSFGTEYVKQASTFLGKDKAFLGAHTPPRDKTVRLVDSNVSASQEWLERERLKNAG
jgi:hypothetical protein